MSVAFGSELSLGKTYRMTRTVFSSLKCLIWATVLLEHGCLVHGQTEKPSRDVEFFESRIRPVLVKHCYECHSSAAAEAKGGLLLDFRDGGQKGGESGPAIVPGHPEESLLIEAVRYDSFEMPPSGKLPDSVIADFEQWIRSGAADPRVKAPSATEAAEESWRAQLVQRSRWWRPAVSQRCDAPRAVPQHWLPVNTMHQIKNGGRRPRLQTASRGQRTRLIALCGRRSSGPT